MGLREENASWLRVRYLGRLLSLQPASVLDVGAGLGQVLAGLRAAGIEATGLEAEDGRRAALGQQGFDVCAGSAEALPHDDDSFEWVSIRHVLHHLADPWAALEEARRVARVGLFLAEPWRDPALPGQEAGQRLDDWMKRQDRRLGREHHADLPLVELTSRLGDPQAAEFETERHQRTRPAALAEFQDDIHGRLQGLDDDHLERDALTPILALAERTGVGLTGSALLVARL